MFHAKILLASLPFYHEPVWFTLKSSLSAISLSLSSMRELFWSVNRDFSFAQVSYRNGRSESKWQ